MKKQKMSILKRLCITYGFILVIVMALIFAAASAYVHSYIERKQIETITEISETIEQWTGTLHIEETDVRSRIAFRSNLIFWGRFINSDIIIVNNNMEIIDSTILLNSIPQEYFDELKTSNRIVRKGDFGGAYDNKVLTVGIPLFYQGTRIGCAFFNMDMPDIQRTAMDLIYVLIIVAFLSMIFAFAMVYFQSLHISEPIRKLNNAVRDIAAGHFEKRVSVDTNDEIGQLASSFNFMASSMEDLEKQRADFISDVSHELRTPMTSISGFVEGILDGTIPPEKHEYYLNIVLEESKRLTKLVNDMLEMSKMSSNEYKLDITKFDINELIRTCIISLENRICDKNLDLNVDFKPEEIKVLADKDSIKRVILNIMDNAIKFSYPNTTVGISTWIEKHKVYVSIGNFGDGIDGSDLSNVFNRFYKTDKSRTTEKTGAGLGLSMVKNIIVLHKQGIWVESVKTKEGSDVKYTKFTFTLEKA